MKTIAIYPGSFNPFTIGHLNILEKAEAIFGKENVYLAVGENPDKDNARLYRDAAAGTLALKLPSRAQNIMKYQGFLVDLIWELEKQGNNVVLIRGLRDEKDFGYELTQLRYNQDLKPDLKVINIVCDRQFTHISSSGYRALEKVKPGSGFRYLGKEENV